MKNFETGLVKRIEITSVTGNRVFNQLRTLRSVSIKQYYCDKLLTGHVVS